MVRARTVLAIVDDLQDLVRQVLPRVPRGEASLLRARTGPRLHPATVEGLVERLGGSIEISDANTDSQITVRVPSLARQGDER